MPRKKRLSRDRPVRGSTTLNDDWDDGEPDDDQVMPAIEVEFPGTVYRVPDGWWGFQAVGREEHPGACTSCEPTRGDAVLLKGTDARNARRAFLHCVILETSPSNGLTKPTAFALEPRTFRAHKMALLHRDRQMGRLDQAELTRLRDGLIRAFPEDQPGGA